VTLIVSGTEQAFPRGWVIQKVSRYRCEHAQMISADGNVILGVRSLLSYSTWCRWDL
jgi:hypothetical protein